MENVIVTAKRADGREFKTVTNADGGFVFGDLPLGAYEFYTNLPKEYEVVAGGNSITQEKDKILLEIRDYACSQRLIFNARLEGGIRIRFDNASSRWSHIILHLLRVRERDGKKEMGEYSSDAAKEKFLATENSGDIGFNHLFKNVPVGRYVLMLSITTDPSIGNKMVYYPGTLELEKAEVINVEAGKTSNIEFSLPDLPEN
ncbi:MAG: carboxypeptidase regulatory-like domain-containing protein [Acidobacteria bacterium]|nr:carboxypeptidase regulatory-like domain-containing protein [Acidobacteriota bacterium]